MLVSDGSGQAVVEGAGAFQLVQGMTLMVVLPGTVPAPTVMVSGSVLNFSIDLPGMEDSSGMGGLGFDLKKQ